MFAADYTSGELPNIFTYLRLKIVQPWNELMYKPTGKANKLFSTPLIVAL